MIEQRKKSYAPSVVGCAVALMFTVSFFLSKVCGKNKFADSLNTILVIITLCLSVQLVRNTSALFYVHVWDSKKFLLLWFIPVFNLVSTAFQLIIGKVEFMSSYIFKAVLVLFSMPVFLGLYFVFISSCYSESKPLKIFSVALDISCALYVFTRMAQKVILPVLTGKGVDINFLIEKIFSFNPLFTIIIYILSLVGFVFCYKLFYGKSLTNKTLNR